MSYGGHVLFKTFMKTFDFLSSLYSYKLSLVAFFLGFYGGFEEKEQMLLLKGF